MSGIGLVPDPVAVMPIWMAVAPRGRIYGRQLDSEN
jgi:hypothetical protein